MAYYTIQQMESFFAVVDCGNVSKASERLFVTQPSLSKTLRRLEEGLGFRLFEREANRLVLTQEGEFFYQRAKPLYQRMSELINTVQNMSRGRSLLRIGYFPGCCTPRLQENIRRFRALHPEVDVLENYMDRRPLREGLSAGKLDVIFSLSYAVKKLTGTRMKAVEKTDLFLFVPADSPMAETGRHDPALLREMTMFFCTTLDTQTFEQNDLKRCREVGFRPKKIAYLENYESCLRAVERGEGVCFGAREERREGLFPIRLTGAKDPPDVVAVWHEHNRNSALVDFLALFPDVGETAAKGV